MTSARREPSFSSATVSAGCITKRYGPDLVLDRATLSVESGARIGLVGVNGAGKSTLLRIMAGLERPDRGRVVHTPVSSTVGYLAQEADARPGELLSSYLGRRTGVAAAERSLKRAESQIGADPASIERHSATLERWLALGGADFEGRAARVAATVGFEEGDLRLPLDALSGGQSARARLAAILLSRFDALLLDEPTNDLDSDGLALLDEFVSTADCGVVIVSHDRAFLENHIDRVVEIQSNTHRTVGYAGGWRRYLERRTNEQARAYDAYERNLGERKRIVESARRRQQWAQRGVARAGRKDEPDKHLRFGNRQGAENLAAKNKATEKRIAALEPAVKPWEGWKLRMNLAAAPRSGEVVFRLEEAVVERGSFSLGPLDMEISWGDRVAIVGPNGAGKSTLLGVLSGRLRLARGRSHVGPSVATGDIDQDRRVYRSSETVLTIFGRLSGAPEQESRSLLARLGIGAEHVLRPARLLSPGERTRCLLGGYMFKEVNCLLLDEPTNHLDLPAIEQLEAALRAFNGTLVVISHDRRLLAALRLTRTLEVMKGQVAEARPPNPLDG